MPDGPLVVCDASNMAYRSHFAFAGLTNSKGHPTGLLYGFMREVLKLKQTYSNRLVFCWDCERAKCWRRREFAGYKAQRHTDPEVGKAMHCQIGVLLKLLPALGYRSLLVDGLEADDLVGLVTFVSRQTETWIYSSDRDLFQLLNGFTRQLVRSTNGRPERTVDDWTVWTEFQVPVEKWPQYLALGGDSSDGITLPRMGPKTAERLIKAGVDLRLPVDHECNAAIVRAGLDKNWQWLRRAYRLASIPRKPDDPRIAKYTTSLSLDWVLGYTPATPSEATFNKFCKQFEMVDLLSKARQFLQ